MTPTPETLRRQAYLLASSRVAESVILAAADAWEAQVDGLEAVIDYLEGRTGKDPRLEASEQARQRAESDRKRYYDMGYRDGLEEAGREYWRYRLHIQGFIGKDADADAYEAALAQTKEGT